MISPDCEISFRFGGDNVTITAYIDKHVYLIDYMSVESLQNIERIIGTVERTQPKSDGEKLLDIVQFQINYLRKRK
jgi:hypothetical protein